MTKRTALLAALGVAASCAAAAPAKDASRSATNPVRDAALASEKIIRKELITPAPIIWNPEPSARKVLLTLAAEATTLRPGTKLRYRVALKNVGRQEYPVYEDPSFLKEGSASLSSAFKVYVRFPDGTESQLPPPILSFQRPAASERTEPSSLFVRLASGETITSRAVPPGSGFRDLDTALRFDRPGRYALRVVYSDGESTAESNRLEFVVTK